MATIFVRNTGEHLQDEAAVAAFLSANEIFYEHWDLSGIPGSLRDRFELSDADKEAILLGLSDAIDRLAKSRGYVKWDVIALSDATPNIEELLTKFEQVHTHTEDEVRAIAAGSGTFVIKGQGATGYFDVHLTAGDVISVPEYNPHFFTLTKTRQVVAVRLFIDPSGWVAHPFIDPAFAAAP
ncbi:MAG: acireductone dioxygenase [Firmicutes bacterium]|nr:acireductone dioxygenase [Bacillota bacterium]